jgi:hypothetical protein
MRARRKDGNHHEVVSEFQRLGCVVEDMTAINNFCDIHVSYANKVFAWVEIKDGNKKLTSGEVKFQTQCKTLGEPYFICRSVDQVNEIVKELKKW